MRSVLLSVLLVMAIQGPAAAQSETAATAADVETYFEQHVRPILAGHCLTCHGSDKQESDLRLDSRAAILRGGASGTPAAVPRQPEASLIIEAIRRAGDLQMPPDEPLSPRDIQTIVEWIQQGLPWPETDVRPATLTITERVDRDRAAHWSFRPVVRPRLPHVDDARWPQTPVDFFVLARLEATRLAPAPAADRRTLIRRATYDLLGLPPTLAEVERFLSDQRQDAYQRLIDRLLASPRYGERWGRHWLDVARYADTRGYAFARDRRYPYAYTYRDYVIQAFNQDVPFQRFVLEQLAADQLDLGQDNRSLAALGFLTVGRKFNNRHDDIDDQIDVVTRGLLGLTVACARCHDHKYDAIPTEDYYSLYGVFASAHEPSDLPLIGKQPDVATQREYLDQLQRKKEALDVYATECHTQFVDQARSHVTDYLAAVVHKGSLPRLEKLPYLSLSPDELRPQLVARWEDYLQRSGKLDHPALMPWGHLMGLPDDEFAQAARSRTQQWRDWPISRINPLVRDALLASPPTAKAELATLYGRLLEETYRQWQEAGGTDKALASLPDERRQLAILIFDDASPTAIKREDIQQYLTREQRERYHALQKEIDQYQVDAPESLPRAMVLQDNDQPADAPVLIRGNPARRGETVPRRVPALLATGKRPAFRHGSGRLDLARAIADQRNPLTARVIVNRVWMHHFAQPLVATPSDLGIRCPEPPHRQLLDYLAWTLTEHGWSLKALHRQIMLSATYQQASADRPDCRRIDPENQWLWRMNRRRLEFEALRDSLLVAAGQLDSKMWGKSVDLLAEPFSRRRAVYGTVDRQDLPNLLRTFDFASPDQSAAIRPRTTVPQQALFLLNSPLVIAQAQAVADRPDLQDRAAPSDYVVALYQQLFARLPRPQELRTGVAFLESAATREATRMTPRQQYAQLLLMTNEFMFVD